TPVTPMIPAAYSRLLISCSHKFFPVCKLADLHKASFNFFIVSSLLSKLIQGLCPNPSLTVSKHFLNLKYFPALISETSEMDNNIKCRRDLPLYCLKREIDPHHHHCLKTVKHIG